MDKVIQKIIKQAKKDKSVLAVALFGSYARGEPHRDIDVCIFLKPGKHESRRMTNIRISYMPYSEKYDVQVFQQLPVYVQREVLRDMNVLHCKDEGALYDVAFETIRDFEHFKPAFEAYLEVVAND